MQEKEALISPKTSSWHAFSFSLCICVFFLKLSFYAKKFRAKIKSECISRLGLSFFSLCDNYMEMLNLFRQFSRFQAVIKKVLFLKP